MVRFTRVVLLKQLSDDEATSIAFNASGLPNIAMYLFGHGTTSGGTITYEEATDDPSKTIPGYDGTWSIIGSANNASDVSAGKVKCIHFTAGAYSLVRARISDAITGGGTISVVLVASE